MRARKLAVRSPSREVNTAVSSSFNSITPITVELWQTQPEFNLGATVALSAATNRLPVFGSVAPARADASFVA